jgi:site-specific recombinase XerD
VPSGWRADTAGFSGALERGESPFVFAATSGEGHFQGAERVWTKVKALAGFPALRLHHLRHSFASMGLARGDALPVIGAILGHADVKTTSRYAHLADDPVRSAADGIAQSVAAALSGDSGAEVINLRNRRT